MKHLTCKNIASALAVWISFVFIQSGFFKFTGAEETVHIFSTVGAWMSQTISPALGNLMTQYGGVGIGIVEYVASVLLLIPVYFHITGKKCDNAPLKTFLGAFISFGVISGAIFFHLFTPLGIEVLGDGGTLFGMAVSVWIAAAILMWKNRSVVCHVKA